MYRGQMMPLLMTSSGSTPPNLLPASAGLAPDEQVAVAAITASELLVGVQRAVTDEQRARREAFVEAILDRMPVLPFDLKSARVHARLVAQLEKGGFRIGAHDLLIAPMTCSLQRLR